MKQSKRQKRKGKATISSREFADLIADHIFRAGEPTRPAFRAEPYSLVGAAGKELRLGNLYDEYLLSPHPERVGRLRAWARVWFEAELPLPKQFDEARPQLRPVVLRRGSHECEVLERRSGSLMTGARRILAEHFAVGVALDRPESLLHLAEESLTTWGVGLDEAIESAVDNLQAVSRGGLVQAAPGIWASPWHDSYDPARILLRELVEGCKVTGSHVVMMPHQNLLIVTGSQDVDGLEQMASMTQEWLALPRFLSGIPLVLTSGGWAPFEPAASHPLVHRFRALRWSTLACDYARQSRLLTADYARRGEDVFTASVMTRPEGTTLSTWAEGIITSLPETQYVAFPGVSPDGTSITIHACGEWDRVREVAVHLMEPQGLYPERYLVRSFPTPEQLGAIGLVGRELTRVVGP